MKHGNFIESDGSVSVCLEASIRGTALACFTKCWKPVHPFIRNSTIVGSPANNVESHQRILLIASRSDSTHYRQQKDIVSLSGDSLQIQYNFSPK